MCGSNTLHWTALSTTYFVVFFFTLINNFGAAAKMQGTWRSNTASGYVSRYIALFMYIIITIIIIIVVKFQCRKKNSSSLFSNEMKIFYECEIDCRRSVSQCSFPEPAGSSVCHHCHLHYHLIIAGTANYNLYFFLFFCFLDRAFSIMKIKNKPTKCTN